MDTRESKAGYSVQANNADTGDVVSETHANMKAALDRSVELLQAGYRILIVSVASRETR